MATKKTASSKVVETLKHEGEKRKNIPTAEFQPVLKKEDSRTVPVKYPRNTDLDPQLVWRGKDEQDWSELVVNAPPLYIQEKVHPKVIIEDLLRQTREGKSQQTGFQIDMFADFNGIPKGVDKTDFYQHDQNWTNRMILGDSLQVMASLAEREGLRGKVQCIYFDPPYGIKFNSNFQWSTTSRDVKDGNAAHITREPEQVKAFRDTWRDGVHSYLTYLRDRLTVARDLLTESGSIFVQIGDENVHRVRALMDEVFGEENFVSLISFRKGLGYSEVFIPSVYDYLLVYAKNKTMLKYRKPLVADTEHNFSTFSWIQLPSGQRRKLSKSDFEEGQLVADGMLLQSSTLVSNGSAQVDQTYNFEGVHYRPSSGSHWKTKCPDGLDRLGKAKRIMGVNQTLAFVRYRSDFPYKIPNNVWSDTIQSTFASDKVYTVQTNKLVVERCILMATDPGDLVLDPTCGSGTTAYVAEQWGRRWITIDTSRVALALARARIMGARYPFYLLADSREGQIKEAEITRSAPVDQPTYGNIRLGFVYERVPHITLKSIANNAEIDVIWEKWQKTLEPLREKLNKTLKKLWEEWEIPREAEAKWPDTTKALHAEWWQARIARQKEIDASIAAKAEFEYLYDKPYEDKRKVRVAGPFTVESLSPHRMLGVDENDNFIDPLETKDPLPGTRGKMSFADMILENLKTAGVQQVHKADRISFTSLKAWPGHFICAEGRYLEGETDRRAGIFIGPEFGTVQRADLVAAAREAADAAFDVLIACAFNYEAHTTEFSKLGRLQVLKARMNADLHMAADLKNTGKGNLFVIFGDPDIEILREKDGKLRVKVKGIDIFRPQTGDVVSNGPDEIACWFVDTDYNEESFQVRHAYFLGANDPYNTLKTTLKAEIDADAWASLHSDTSRPFEKPSHGRIAVKVINHLGDEVLKVLKV